MKKLLGVFLLLCSIQSFCQTINKADIEPQLGEVYLRHSIDNANDLQPGSGGTGQIWDLSNALFSLQNDYYFKSIDPLNTPYNVPGSVFAVENYPVIDTTYAGYTFYKDTTNGYYVLHDFGQVIEINYLSPEFVYQFPLNYGDSISSSYCYSSTGLSITYNYCGTSKLTFDGVGTLYTGSAIIPNAYRLKYERVTIRQSPNDTGYTTKYYWYQTGVHHPIVEYSSYIDPNGFNYITSQFYESQNLTSIVDLKEQEVLVFPNPVTSSLVIKSGSVRIAEYRLCDLTGKKILQGQVYSSNEKIDLTDIKDGTYFLHLFGEGKEESRQKIIKISY